MTVFSAHTISAVLPGVAWTEPDTEIPTVVEHEAEQVYFDGTGINIDTQWTTSGSHSPDSESFDGNPGSYNLWAGYVEVTSTRSFTGLQIGRSYTFSAVAKAWIAEATADIWIGVTGKGIGAVVEVDGAEWYEVSHTFTATATSHEVVLHGNGTGGNYTDTLWDALTLTKDQWAEPGDPIFVPGEEHDDYPLHVVSSSISVDESNIPYARLELECSLPPEDVLEQINPLDGLRIEVELEQTFGSWNAGGWRADQTRTFDLTVAARDVNHDDGGSLSITSGSDEFLLQMFTLVSEVPFVGSGLSVKDMVQYALDQIGATLAPGAADGTLDNTDPITVSENLLTNPGGEVNTTGWLSGAAATTISRNTAQFRSGASSIAAATTSTVITAYIMPTAGIPALAGDMFNASVWVKLNTGTGSASLILRSLTSASATVTNHSGTAVAVNSTTWTRVSVAATLAGATVANVSSYLNITGVTAGRIAYMDDAQLTRGLALLTEFNGSKAPSGLDYYEWTGDANASTSVHKIKANGFTTWQPGENAWDWVSPAVQATGLRLWCDEHRVWHLDEGLRTLPGLISLSDDDNVTEASDSISALDDSDFVVGVVVEYRWPDPVTGLEQVKRDVAGTSGKAILVRHDRPYPGPGAAQAILDRAAGKGRTFAVEAMSNYTANPGQSVAIELPSSPVQLGVITAINWRYPEYRMTVSTKGLTDIPDEAWLLAPPTRTWATAPGNWNTYTN